MSLAIQFSPPSEDSYNEPKSSKELSSVEIKILLEVGAPIPLILRFVGMGL